MKKEPFISTTVLGVIKNGKAVLGADGQVTFGSSVLKTSARKVRKIDEGKILAGFAGSTADAFTLLQRFEEKLKATRSNMQRAAVELAKDWRTDRYLRRLEAMLIVMSKEKALLINGAGDVVEPEDNIVSIGSGSGYALAAARALAKNSSLNAREIVEKSLKIASEICIYTNDNIIVEEIEQD